MKCVHKRVLDCAQLHMVEFLSMRSCAQSSSWLRAHIIHYILILLMLAHRLNTFVRIYATKYLLSPYANPADLQKALYNNKLYSPRAQAIGLVPPFASPSSTPLGAHPRRRRSCLGIAPQGGLPRLGFLGARSWPSMRQPRARL